MIDPVRCEYMKCRTSNVTATRAGNGVGVWEDGTHDLARRTQKTIDLTSLKSHDGAGGGSGGHSNCHLPQLARDTRHYRGVNAEQGSRE